MDIQERLLALAAGSPIGGATSPRPTDPYDEFEYDDDPRPLSEAIFRFALISVVALMVACCIASVAYGATKGGYWAVTTETNMELSMSKTVFKFFSEKGKLVDEIEFNGKKYNQKNGEYYTIDNGTMSSGQITDWSAWDKGGKNAPKGYKLTGDHKSGGSVNNNSNGTQWTPNDNKQESQDTADTMNGSSELDLEDKVISENPPEFQLSFSFFKYAAENLVWSLCRGLADNATSLAEWCIGLVTATANNAFTSDFSTGAFGQFYNMASTLSKNAFQPYAMAFLGLTFGVALMHQLDVRRKMAGVDIMASLAFVVMMFAVSYTLIIHAMDICAAVYLLAQRLVVIVNNTLASIGINTSASVGIKEQVLKSFDSLTYAQAGTSFILLILAIVALVACVACLFSVLTTIFVRVGEIYLRAAASPLCLSFFADDKSRAMGVGYLKRFAAVCFQAVMIVIAIGMIPLLMSVATDLVAPITSDTSGLKGFGDAVAALIPSMCAVLCITEVVNKSKIVANSLFGLV